MNVFAFSLHVADRLGLVTWLPIIFMGLVGILLWHTRSRCRARSRCRSSPTRCRRSAGTTSPAPTRPRPSCARSSSSCATPSASAARRARPDGILLHGPPGTGKTLLAKAVAHESGAQFLSQSAASFVEMFAGLGAARIRRLFRVARKHAPASSSSTRSTPSAATAAWTTSPARDRRSTSCSSSWTASARANVVVIAASNLLEKLDTALLRPGRFDRQVFVSPPGVDGREACCSVHTKGKPLARRSTCACSPARPPG